MMQSMRDVLRGSLGRSLRELPEEDRLAAAWPVACGSALAGHARVLHLDAENVLHVRVTGSAWMQPFLQMRSTLTSDLARIARKLPGRVLPDVAAVLGSALSD